MSGDDEDDADEYPPRVETKPPKPIDEDEEAQLAQMRGYCATYRSVVEKARASKEPDTPDEAIVKRALDAFEKLEKEFHEAESDEARSNIVERAEEVEQTRAYIQPKAELVVEANTLVADMTDWGVPHPVLRAIDRDLLSVITSKTNDLPDKRAALNKLYQYYDAWSEHVASYERWATRTAWVLGVLLIASAVGCILSIAHCKPLHGFMVAGLTGALLSVLGKFPPMLGWGQWASYTPRMLGRITTGVVTTLAGGALLSLDVIKLGETEFVAMFSGPTTKHMMLLVGLGVVFGFSERALVQFQDLVFSRDKANGSRS